nr:BLTX658 [Nephila pilipes]
MAAYKESLKPGVEEGQTWLNH